MILKHRKLEHCFADDPDYQYMEATWVFIMEESDIPDPKTLERFKRIEITQRKNLSKNNKSRSWDLLTWFKGSRTNVFGKDTKDSTKREIIKMMEQKILDNNVPILYLYESSNT